MNKLTNEGTDMSSILSCFTNKNILQISKRKIICLYLKIINEILDISALHIKQLVFCNMVKLENTISVRGMFPFTFLSLTFRIFRRYQVYDPKLLLHILFLIWHSWPIFSFRKSKQISLKIILGIFIPVMDLC